MNEGYITNKEIIDLSKLLDLDFRGPKYLASRMGMTFKDLRRTLLNGELTPNSLEHLCFVAGYTLEQSNFPDENGNYEFFLRAVNSICNGWFWRVEKRASLKSVEKLLYQVIDDYLDAEAVFVAPLNDKKVIIVHDWGNTSGIIFNPNWQYFHKIDTILSELIQIPDVKDEYGRVIDYSFYNQLSSESEAALNTLVQIQGSPNEEHGLFYRRINAFSNQINSEMDSPIKREFYENRKITE